AWLTWLGYRRLPDPGRVELLFGVLGALWLLWAISPFLTFGLNEGLDPDRLQPYPLTRRELAAGLALASLIDLWSLPAGALLAAAAAGWIASFAAAPLVVAALLLAYFHQVALSQVLANAFAGVLRSRRFRDAAVFVTAIVGSSFWLVQQATLANMRGVRSLEHLAAVQPSQLVRWLPPGWAAEAIRAADRGGLALALGWLGTPMLALALPP